MAQGDRAPEFGGGRRASHLVRGLDRVEPRLDAVDVVAGVRERILLDLGLRALAHDVADAVGLEEDEVAAADQVVVAIESADRGPGGAVPLLVVLAAMAGTAEPGRKGGDERDLTGALRLRRLLLAVEDGAVRLDRAAEVRAPVGDDREARPSFGGAVVAHVRGLAADLALGGGGGGTSRHHIP